MLASPIQTPDEARANATYEALLWAMSRPGIARDLSEPGEAAIIDALIDRESSVYCADPLLMAVALRAGARVADVPDADHVFLGALSELALLDHIVLGSDLYPDDAATLVLRAHLDEGPRLRLTGPGVDGQLILAVAGLPEGFWDKRRALIRYPMGFDLFLIDGVRVVGLPRSTKVEVL